MTGHHQTAIEADDTGPTLFEALAELDRAAAAGIAWFTGGLSPVTVGLAFADWAAHLAIAPGRQARVAIEGWSAGARMARDVLRHVADAGSESAARVATADPRFADEAWQDFPFWLAQCSFLDAADLAAHDIRVHALSTGPVKTRAASGIDRFDALMDRVRERTPANHLVTVEEIGRIAAFLASDAGAPMTGSVIFADHGFHVVA